tara:strand:- start:2225 stop:2530 length:306 start_codon:yes stop_codon:yes gene_type:complete
MFYPSDPPLRRRKNGNTYATQEEINEFFEIDGYLTSVRSVKSYYEIDKLKSQDDYQDKYSRTYKKVQYLESVIDYLNRRWETLYSIMFGKEALDRLIGEKE